MLYHEEKNKTYFVSLYLWFIFISLTCYFANKNIYANVLESDNINKLTEPPRLPLTVIPQNYELHFEPDFLSSTFTATEKITINLKENTNKIVIHSKELNIKKIYIVTPEEKKIIPKISQDNLRQWLVLSFPEQIKKGSAYLHIDFEGKFSNNTNGFIMTQEDGYYYAGTMLENIYARTMFPCFDEPSMKAYFNISVTIPSDLKAISNGDLIKIVNIDEKKQKIFYFSQSPYMSTYLVALSIGKFTTIEDKTDTNVPIRVHSTEQIDKEIIKKILNWIKIILPKLEKLMNIPYPYSKLDYIYIPTYDGALETTAAIQSSDSPLRSQHLSLQIEQETITHEISHQWFGNLVTMKWWDDIWLNEAFASWVESILVEFPDLKEAETASIMKIQEDTMQKDARTLSHPVRVASTIPELEYWQNTDMAYGKGSLLLEMISNWVGKPNFWKGITNYINKYKEQNTTSEMFWESMEKSLKMPVQEISRAWFERSGFPVVTLDAYCKNNKTIVSYKQNRMFANKPEMLNEEYWNIPIIYSHNFSTLSKILLKKQKETIVLNNCAPVFPNVQGIGYYRIMLTENAWSLLKNNLQKLDTKERFILIRDAFKLTLAGYFPFSRYLEMLSVYKEEQSIEIFSEIFINQFNTISSFMGESEKSNPKWKRLEKSFLDKLLNKISLEETKRSIATNFSTDTKKIKTIKTDLLFKVGMNQLSDDIIKMSNEYVQNWISKNIPIPSEIKKNFFRIAIHNGNNELFETIKEKYKKLASSSLEANSLLTAILTEAPEQYMEEVLKFCTSSDIKTFSISHLCFYNASKNLNWKHSFWNWAAKNSDLFTKTFSEQSIEEFVVRIGDICDAEDRKSAYLVLNAFNRKDEEFSIKKRKTFDKIDTCIVTKKYITTQIKDWLNNNNALN